MSGHDLLVTVQTLLAICGGISVIVAGLSSITKMMSPFKELQKTVNEHSIAIKKSDEKFERLGSAIEKQNAAQREVCKSLIVIMNHEITGNSIDKLKAQQEELQTFLINN